MKIVNKEIYVHCPTEKLYVKVVDKLIEKENHSLGNDGYNGMKKNCWSEYGKETTIDCSNDRNIFHRNPKSWYQENEPEMKMITANQYLGNKEPIDKFIVSWNTKGCGDPQERFATFTEADKKARELTQDKDVVISSIDIVEIKNRWKITPIITIKKVK